MTARSLALALVFAASAASAGTWDGTLKLGGVIMNQTGDRSTVQETYNVYTGFAVTDIRLTGMPDPRNYLMLDLQDINLDSRHGELVYRMPGTLKVTGAFDQHRQIFDPDAAVFSRRKDWRLGAAYTPLQWLEVTGAYGQQNRTGDRLPFPAGTVSVLGTGYDNSLKTGDIGAEVRKGRRGGGVLLRMSDFNDALDPAGDRSAQVLSARFYTPCMFYDKWTHFVRAAYGKRKLSDGGLDHTLSSFQYTGIVEPAPVFQFRYNFDANRVDDQSTKLMTDRFQNNFDATYRYRYGRVTAGYGYEMNDDDRTLTTYHSWLAGGDFRYGKKVSARLDYAGRIKKDQEELTLLKDLEASRVSAKLQLEPVENLVLGGTYNQREREFTDIHVRGYGEVVGAYGRYDYKSWGAATVDYSHSKDEYRDLAAGFRTNTDVVTGRIEFDRIKDLRLVGGVTWLWTQNDVDIEKSILNFEGAYRVLDDYSIELKYNIYNYDDYILLDRYYTANVFRISLGYDVHVK